MAYLCKSIKLNKMAFFLYRKISKINQYFMSFALVILVAGICYFFSALIGYKVVALILLVTVSLIAMFFDIAPVLLSAIISAFVWNFFFIPPKFTVAIHSTEDVPMFFMYLKNSFKLLYFSSTISSCTSIIL